MRRAILVSTALAPILAAACYPQPLRANGPLVSPQGVRVALVGQDCEDHAASAGDDYRGNHDLAVKVRIVNDAGEPLRVDPSSVRLRVHGEQLRPASPRSLPPIPTGASSDVVFRFFHDADCRSTFEVDFARSLAVGGVEPAIGRLQFTPY